MRNMDMDYNYYENYFYNEYKNQGYNNIIRPQEKESFMKYQRVCDLIILDNSKNIGIDITKYDKVSPHRLRLRLRRQINFLNSINIENNNNNNNNIINEYHINIIMRNGIHTYQTIEIMSKNFLEMIRDIPLTMEVILFYYSQNEDGTLTIIDKISSVSALV